MEHFYENIPGWFNCLPLYKTMVLDAADGARFVEIGAWKGKSAAFMAVEIANSGKNISFYVVDNFKGSIEHQEDPDVVNETLEQTFWRNIDPVKDFVEVFVKDSVACAALFDDASLDFVYIDGSHEYEHVLADIEAWLPKVKKGGMLAGDDYSCYPGVRQAVDEWLPNAQIDGNIWMFRK